MTIEELAKKYAHAIPNSKLVKYYEAAIPQFSMEMILTMEKEKPLSLLQEFIMKFVAEGINEVKDIYTFLGLSSACVNTAIASLQEPGLVTVDIYNASIKLTEKGKEALKSAKTIVPEDIEYRVFMDGLTGEVYMDTLRKYQKKELRAFEMMPIPPNVETPKIQDVQYEDVKAAIVKFRKENVYAKDKLEGTLLSIAGMEKVYTEYNKVSILIYVNKSDEIELRVYEKSSRRQDYENILLQMHNKHTRIFEWDVKKEVDEEQEPVFMNIISDDIKDEARAYTQRSAEIAKELTQLQTQLNAYQEQTSDEKSIESDNATEEIAELRKRIEEMEEERRSANRVLSTYDHRPLLIRALNEVQNTVVIISPWIKRGGLNNEILRLIENAVRDGKRVIIGYGISEEEDSDKYTIDRLKDIAAKKHKGKLELKALNNTHEKVLLMDNKFLVITSFNWLSFKGDPKRGFRQETGIYTESKESIKAMKENLSQPDRLGIQL